MDKVQAALPPQTDAGAHANARRSLSAIIVVGSCAIVLAIYVWLISVGTWSHWPAHWYAYDALASSFRHGQLALSVKPSPALLALSNPYDPAARQGIPFPPDVSLYNGRFYYYWGPVPALFVAIAESITAGPIGDQYLVFAFTSGIFLLEAFFVTVIRARFFPDASPWTLIPIILAVGLVCPLVMALSRPTIYAAAIAAGQFFFLAGFMAAFAALDRNSASSLLLFLAGLLWAGALGSRITQIIPIGFMVLLVVAMSILESRRAGTPSKWISKALALVSMPALALAALCWYNWARFGSIFETGIKYQLAGPPLQQYGSAIYSPLFVVQNLYNYALNPPLLKYPFPYFNPALGSIKSVVGLIPLPPIYRSQEVTGLTYTAPFLLLALLPIASILPRRAPALSSSQEPIVKWLIIGLAGSTLFGSVFFLSFFWAAERYLLDFLPTLLILGIIGIWQLDQHWRAARRVHAVYWVVISALIIAGALISILLSMSLNSDSFRQLNPLLWRQLSNLFRP